MANGRDDDAAQADSESSLHWHTHPWGTVHDISCAYSQGQKDLGRLT